MMKTIIIAEAGVNHNGSLETALKMVDVAVDASADYIKFQTFKTANMVTKSCNPAEYQKKNAGAVSQAEMLRKLELSYDAFRRINQYCKEKGIGFLSTAFDDESIAFLVSLSVDFMKVPSGEITNLPYLRKIAETGIPVIISTGMCDMDDVKAALIPFQKIGYTEQMITLLHCTTQYPTPAEDVNLFAMNTLRRSFGCKVGYSDHTRGIEIPIAATALGAGVIEKHFTLSRTMEGPDHLASLEPQELKEMVSAIRNVSKALGDGEKRIRKSEKENIAIARRSIVAAKHIKKGSKIMEDDIIAKRPADGLSPMLWDSVVGSKAKKDFLPDDLIEL